LAHFHTFFRLVWSSKVNTWELWWQKRFFRPDNELTGIIPKVSNHRRTNSNN